MTHKPTRRLQALLPVSLMLLTWTATMPMQAEPAYFDPGNSQTGTGSGGAGTWDSAGTADWYNGVAGPDVLWSSLAGNSNVAYFGGPTGGVVALPGGVTSAGLAFAVNGYDLSGNGPLTLISQPVIQVNSGTATIDCALAGVGGYQKAGAGTLDITGTASNHISGAAVITGGTLEISNSAALGAGITAVDLASGVTLQSDDPSATGNLVSNSVPAAINLTGSDATATIDVSSPTGILFYTSTSSVNISGPAAGFTKTGPGTLWISGNANTYGGPTIINQGTVSLGGDRTTVTAANLGGVPSSFTFNNITLGGGTLSANNTTSFHPNRGILLTANSTLDVNSDLPFVGYETFYGGFNGSNVSNYGQTNIYCDSGEYACLVYATNLANDGMLAYANGNFLFGIDCWIGGRSNGVMYADPTRFPHGMPWLINQLHAMGMKVQLYDELEDTSYLSLPCSGAASSPEFVTTDANTFAAWGVDAVAVDILREVLPDDVLRERHELFQNALKATGRPIYYTGYFSPQTYTNGFQPWMTEANAWRCCEETGSVSSNQWADICSRWDFLSADSANMSKNHRPEAIVVGCSGMQNYNGYQGWLQLSIVAMFQTDMIFAQDPLGYGNGWNVFVNPLIRRLQTDALYVPPIKIATNGANTEAWRKPLDDGSIALFVLNRSNLNETISIPSGALGVASNASLSIASVFFLTNYSTSGTITFQAPSDTCSLWIVNPNGTSNCDQGLGHPSGQMTINGAIAESGGSFGITKTSGGILALAGVNTYTGNTVISAGELALITNGSLSSSSSLSIAGGALFDVSSLTSSTYTLGNGATLSASGAGPTTNTGGAVINGAAGGTINLGSRPISLSFTPTTFNGDTAHPSLYISQGALTLGGNSIAVNNASATPLQSGAYTLIQVAGGTINGAPNASVSVTGSGLAAGATASIMVSGGNVNLVVTGGALPPGLTITGVRLSGTTLTITATHGSPSMNYVLLESTNVALPLPRWTRVLTNSFDQNGNINLSTNLVHPGTLEEFYIIQSP